MIRHVTDDLVHEKNRPGCVRSQPGRKVHARRSSLRAYEQRKSNPPRHDSYTHPREKKIVLFSA